jgi:CheY-like chemotaxis protein
MNNPVKPIRVMLADDHTLVRAGIRALLEKLPGVEVVGEAGDGREVLNLVKRTAGCGFDGYRHARSEWPGSGGAHGQGISGRAGHHSFHAQQRRICLARAQGGRGRLPAQESGDGRTGNRPATGGSRGNLSQPGNLHATAQESFPCRESPTGKARSNS